MQVEAQTVVPSQIELTLLWFYLEAVVPRKGDGHTFLVVADGTLATLHVTGIAVEGGIDVLLQAVQYLGEYLGFYLGDEAVGRLCVDISVA